MARPRPVWQSPAQTRPAVRRARRAEATASLNYCAPDIVLDNDELKLLGAHSYRTIFDRVPVTGDELIDDDQRLASMVRPTVPPMARDQSQFNVEPRPDGVIEKRIGQVGTMRSVIAMPPVLKGVFNSGAPGL
jgi:hypothetical protein